MPGPRGTSEDTDSRMKPGTSTENGINIVIEQTSEQRILERRPASRELALFPDPDGAVAVTAHESRSLHANGVAETDDGEEISLCKSSGPSSPRKSVNSLSSASPPSSNCNDPGIKGMGAFENLAFNHLAKPLQHEMKYEEERRRDYHRIYLENPREQNENLLELMRQLNNNWIGIRFHSSSRKRITPPPTVSKSRALSTVHTQSFKSKFGKQGTEKYPRAKLASVDPNFLQ
ncbi:hypothetical protein MG293_019797 [Ovis ammon polii]|uniref:Uncharacterized protein n=1 Tax=Ovis ammon polii TaxID=230172 RepID=A0AAD4TN09_OVIAM|nr:hypothetical protein MG293_019797 [Ovis ammon polii]KAI4553147.1 hypothetical protein MJT46_016441 [Ovis ammon polii x Ovis aries]